MAHEAAKKKAKAIYAGCVFTSRGTCDGMHVYPASNFPELANDWQNIFPGWSFLHYISSPSFDYLENGSQRPIAEKIWILKNLSLPEYRARVNDHLEELDDVCRGKGVPTFHPVQPSDLAKLLHGRRVC